MVKSSSFVKLKSEGNSKPRALSTANFNSKNKTENTIPEEGVHKDQKYIDRLEEIIFKNNQEITKLQHVNLFLEQGIRKKEELARIYFEENLRLKETIKIQVKQIVLLKQKKENTPIEGTLLTEGSHPFSQRDSHNRTIKSLYDPIERRSTVYDELSQSISLEKRNQTLNIISQKKSSHFQAKKRLQEIVEKDPYNKQEKTMLKENSRIKFDPVTKTVTVSVNKRKKDFESVIIGKFGRSSVLEMSKYYFESFV